MARSSRRGVSLIEIIVAVAVLVLGFLGLLASMLYATRSNQVNRESTQAMQAAQRVVEMMMAENFEDIFSLYNAAPGDDPAGAGTAPGRHFDVLSTGAITFPATAAARMFVPRTDDGDGRVGLIEFPQNGTSLVETQPNNLNGLGNTDLNEDGVLDTADHAADYDVLPVAITVAWYGTGGNRTVTYRTILVRR